MTTRLESHRALVGGSVLVAALSSACCWLPLLAVGLGLSAAGVGSVFEAYRWPLVALAVGFIVRAVVLQRRRRRACTRDGCAPPSGRGLLAPILGGVFVLAFAVFPDVLAWTAPGPAPHTDGTATTMTRTYSVTGMTCEGCTTLLDSYLEDQPEVVRATIVYTEATAKVEFVEGTTTAEANGVMERVSADWEGKYRFTPPSHE